MKRTVSKRDLGILLIILDILITIFTYKYLEVPQPELVLPTTLFVTTYFSRSKLFFVGLILILLDCVDKRRE